MAVCLVIGQFAVIGKDGTLIRQGVGEDQTAIPANDNAVGIVDSAQSGDVAQRFTVDFFKITGTASITKGFGDQFQDGLPDFEMVLPS